MSEGHPRHSKEYRTHANMGGAWKLQLVRAHGAMSDDGDVKAEEAWDGCARNTQ